MPTPGIAIRRDAFGEINGFRQLYIGEDMDLWLRAGCLSNFIRIISPPVCAERRHTERITKNLDKTLQGLNYIFLEEARKAYPGDAFSAKAITQRLSSAARSVSLCCLNAQRYQEAWLLYIKALRVNVLTRRWRYLLGFPMIAISKALFSYFRLLGNVKRTTIIS